MLIVAAAAGCYNRTKRHHLTSRAQRDLACPEQQLQVERISDKERRVSGCGKTAIYVTDCDFDVEGKIPLPEVECAWEPR